VRGYRAVLLDWRGTLVHYHDAAWWIRRALEAVGRPRSTEIVGDVLQRLQGVAHLPEVLDAERREDLSWELNLEATLLRFERAGLDPQLAEAVHRLDSDPANFPLYPDAREAIDAVRARGVLTAIVSDIHYDLRADVARHGLADRIDAYALSFEVGIQKPHPRIFTAALEALDVAVNDAVMVGDRASHDGGAAAIGMATLILPMPRKPTTRRLGAVVPLVHGGTEPTALWAPRS
jgi:HAD superfamily hydrolase (TIGR01509 family)